MSANREMPPSQRLEAAVGRLYRCRVPDRELAQRAAVWRVLCRAWLSRYIPKQGRLLDVAAGYCEFINNVEAAERVAIDLNPETKRHAAPGVIVHEIAAERLGDRVRPSYFDTAFVSNFLEHCRSRSAVLAVLRAVAIALKPGGRVLILGPNFRFVYRRYFDYFDHYLPLTEKSVVEALQLVGFAPEVVLPKTLPFTFRSRLPRWPWLVRAYLRLPWLWRVFGAQFFVVAKKVAPPGSLERRGRRAA
jgi:SAM-dependent methyltransferase